jgi:uncharacterized membrane protein
MKIEENVSGSFACFFKDPWIFILAGLIGMALSVVTLGILAPVMALGIAEMFYKTRDGSKAVIDDLFTHMGRTLDLAIQGFLIGVCVLLGCIMLIIPGLLLMALWIYAPYYLVYKNMGIIDSLKASTAAVKKNGLMMHVVIILVTLLVNAIGIQIVIGVLLTYPLVMGFIGFLFSETSEIKESGPVKAGQ